MQADSEAAPRDGPALHSTSLTRKPASKQGLAADPEGKPAAPVRKKARTSIASRAQPVCSISLEPLVVKQLRLQVGMVLPWA